MSSFKFWCYDSDMSPLEIAVADYQSAKQQLSLDQNAVAALVAKIKAETDQVADLESRIGADQQILNAAQAPGGTLSQDVALIQQKANVIYTMLNADVSSLSSLPTQSLVI